MATNFYTSIDDIITALKADSTFTGFCTTTFGEQPSYQLGIDSENPPPNLSLPIVILNPSQVNENLQQYQECTVQVGCACTDDTQTTVSGTTKYAGIDTIIKFEKALFDAIQRYFNEATSTHKESLVNWGAATFNMYYPQFHAVREITFSAEYDAFTT